MQFSILTLFPEYFDSAVAASLLGRARAGGLLRLDFVQLREFGEGKYRAVDDKPYGGGAGMVMMPTVLERALASVVGAENLERLEQDVRNFRGQGAKASELPHVVYLSPQGKKLDAAKARELARLPHLALVCGHYEGVDERAIETLVHEELSIGDFILTGGEPAALVLIDAVSRFIPGVVGEQASVEGDTFEKGHPEVFPGGLKAPVYTRPAVWRNKAIPPVLLSGHHAEISKWRLQMSREKTIKRRPELGLDPQPSKTRALKAQSKRPRTRRKTGKK